MWFDNGFDRPLSDYEDIQEYAVQSAVNGDIFVEVGSFVGEGLSYLIDRVRESGKQIDIYAVDLWDINVMINDGDHRKAGDPLPTLDDTINNKGLTSRKWIHDMGPRCMLAEFYRNLSHNDRDKYLTGALVGATAKMAARFADNSIQFCFIDASHGYEGVKLDIAAWYPKMKKGGIFAGHDWFSGPSIRRAVTEFAESKGLDIRIGKSSWVLTPH